MRSPNKIAQEENSVFYFGWSVAVVAMSAAMVNGGIRATFGVLIPEIESTINISRADVSLIASLNLILIGCLAPFLGSLIDRFGGREVLTLGMLICAIGVIGTGFATSIWEFYLYYGILISIGISMGAPSCVSAVISPWFVKKRGLALAIGTAGSPFGQFLFTPVAGLLIALWALEGFAAIGFIIGLIIAPLIYFVVRKPEEKSPIQKTDLKNAQIERTSLRDVMGNAQFWALAIGMFVCGYTSAGVMITHLIPHAANIGLSHIVGIMAVSLVGLANFTGVMSVGYISDFVNRRTPLMLLYFLRGGAQISLIFVASDFGLIAVVLIYGFTHSSTMSTTSALVADYFGKRSVGIIYGAMLFGHQIGAGLGAYLGGIDFDITGNYNATFIGSATLAILAGVVSLLLLPRSAMPVGLIPSNTSPRLKN